MSPADGFDRLRQMRDGAEEVPVPPPPEDERGNGGGREEESPFLPDGCPVVALGTHDDLYYYLDQLGQLRSLKAKDHSRLNVQSLFGRKAELLYQFWPRRTQDRRTQEWVTTGWKPELAAESLMSEASRQGVWSPQERVRGAGAWTGTDGELILHLGDELLLVEPGRPAEPRDPGLVDRRVYPTAPPRMKPAPLPEPGGPDGAAAEALELFRTWNWRRKEVDPYLLLGFIAACMLGGALPWRVLVWITGGYGTGKTTLQNAVKWCMGENGILQTADATAAAVRQILKHASLPVAIDEAEAEEDGRKMQALIKLARDAASGSLSIRGGADHEAAQFTVRSCFMFSSILVPPLLPQDRSRMAILELDRLEAGKKSAAITERRMGELGARLLRRLVDGWPRFAQTIEAYRTAMGAAGHSARGQDVFGTLLACAHLLFSDRPPDESTLKAWQNKLAAASLAELEADVPDENACLNHLLSTVAEQPHDRLRMPLGQWLGRAAGQFDREIEQKGRDKSNAVLQDHGLKVVQHEARTWLAVANMHRGLARVFDGTQWAARPGAQGVWVQAIRRLPHVVPKKAIWFGVASKATLLPLHICLPPAGDSRTATDIPTPGPASAGPDPSACGPGGASAFYSDVPDDPLSEEDGVDEQDLRGPDTGPDFI